MSQLKGKIEMMLIVTLIYNFSENSINNMGYELLSADRIADAIENYENLQQLDSRNKIAEEMLKRLEERNNNQRHLLGWDKSYFNY